MEKITAVGVTPEFKEFDKINEIYEEAFPPAERKLTLEQMLALPMFKLDVNAYYCDGKVVGMSVTQDIGTFVYLLFFAVDKTMRSSGFGGRILGRIIEDCGGKPLIFSIEDPSEECANKEQRIKREAFYLKHNCVYIGFKFKRPELGSTFLLMSSAKLDDYSSITEAACAINPMISSIIEKY